MDTKRGQEKGHEREPAARVELRRAPARRDPYGALQEFGSAEVSDDVRSVVMQLAGRVDELTGELDRTRRQVAELETLADEDLFLPVLNRRGFMRELARTIAFVVRYQPLAALIHVRIRSLRATNEAFGHDAGDEVLTRVAVRIRSIVRASDVVGRVGGDEFAIILWAATEEEAMRKADRIAARVSADTVTVEGLVISVSATAGATAVYAEDTSGTALSRAASASAGSR